MLRGGTALRSLSLTARPSITEPLPLPLPFGPAQPQPNGPTDFHLNLGKVVEVLRKDYPRMFVQRPDMSIYARDIEFHRADSGATLRGIEVGATGSHPVRHKRSTARNFRRS